MEHKYWVILLSGVLLGLTGLLSINITCPKWIIPQYKCNIKVNEAVKEVCEKYRLYPYSCFRLDTNISTQFIDGTNYSHKYYILCNPTETDCTDQYHNMTFPCYWVDKSMGFSIHRLDNPSLFINIFVPVVIIILLVFLGIVSDDIRKNSKKKKA